MVHRRLGMMQSQPDSFRRGGASALAARKHQRGWRGKSAGGTARSRSAASSVRKGRRAGVGRKGDTDTPTRPVARRRGSDRAAGGLAGGRVGKALAGGGARLRRPCRSYSASQRPYTAWEAAERETFDPARFGQTPGVAPLPGRFARTTRRGGRRECACAACRCSA